MSEKKDEDEKIGAQDREDGAMEEILASPIALLRKSSGLR